MEKQHKSLLAKIQAENASALAAAADEILPAPDLEKSRPRREIGEILQIEQRLFQRHLDFLAALPVPH